MLLQVALHLGTPRLNLLHALLEALLQLGEPLLRLRHHDFHPAGTPPWLCAHFIQIDSRSHMSQWVGETVPSSVHTVHHPTPRALCGTLEHRLSTGSALGGRDAVVLHNGRRYVQLST
jgi:hypothetical protein